MISNIYLEILSDVFTRLVELILIENDIKHLRRTLRQLLCSHQLDVDVPRLSLNKRNCEAVGANIILSDILLLLLSADL